MNSRQNLNNLQRAQHGGALILMVLILILGVAAVMMSSISALNSRPAVVLDPVTKQGLIAAKEGLLTWAAMRGITAKTDVPPGLLPYPDRRTGGSYDGNSDCPNSAQLNPINPVLRLGKLPVLGETVPCRSRDGAMPESLLKILDARDSSQEVIWYAVSTNLLDDYVNSMQTISSKILAGTTSNWLTVCDQKGNLLSSQVAFVVMAPGPVLPGQSRVAAAPMAPNFLDAYSLPSSGTAPCNNAAESNSDSNDIFIANLGDSTQFNDQLLYVTKQELFTRVTMALAKNISKQLNDYYAANGNKFPDPAANAIPNDGSCVTSTPINTWGFFPVQCSTLSTTTPPFMIDSSDPFGWYSAINYKVTDVAHQKVKMRFDQCAIEYTYEWNGSQFVFSHNLPTC